MPTEKKYTITLENKAVVTVTLSQLYKDRWITYFGGVDKVNEFIKNYI